MATHFLYRRRDFISLLGGAAAAWPLMAWAQENDRTYRLGFLLPSARQTPPVEAFFDELRLNGFVEGKNLSVVPGGFESTDENLAERAAALVNAAPDAIIAGPAPPLRALHAITRSVPLIGMSEDMVGEGLAASLARPGGNITGISLLSPELDGKRQDILIEAVPGARRIAAMADSRQTPPYHLQTLQHAARSRGVELRFLASTGPRRLHPRSMLQRHRVPRRLIFWRPRCSPFQALAITRSSWNVSPQCASRQFFNGLKRRKRARLQHTARGLTICTVSGREWW
jgi:putative tryptophan/tyrosine transport system substrate-binding protein